MAYTDYLETVQKIYIAYYQRPADPEGLIYWAERLDAVNGNLDAIINAFANSPESQALYGEITDENIADVVKAIYNAAFNRDPDPEGLKFYVENFKAGKFTPATIMLNILDGARDSDLVVLNHKIESAMNFTKALDPELDGKNILATYDSNDIPAARDFLKDVGASPATVKTYDEAVNYIKEKIADEGDPILTLPVEPTVKVLTINNDTVIGTDGDDTFKAPVVLNSGTGASVDTLDPNDVIDGKDGNDTLELYTTGQTLLFPVMNNVENLVIKNIGTFASIYYMDQVTGLESIEKAPTANNITFNDLKNVVSIVDKDNIVGGNLNINYLSTAVSGDSDEQKITVENVNDAITLAGGDIEKVSIETKGLNNTLTLNTQGTEEIKVSGEAPIDLTVAGNNVDYKVDASELKKALDITIGTSVNVDVIGSKNNDTLTIDDKNDDKYVSFDGAEGTDTLLIDLPAAGDDYKDSDFHGKNKDDALKNIEKVVIDSGVGVTVNLSNQTEGFEIVDDNGANTIYGGQGKDTINLDKDTATDNVYLPSPFAAVDKIKDFEGAAATAAGLIKAGQQDKLYIDFEVDYNNSIKPGKFGGLNIVDNKFATATPTKPNSAVNLNILKAVTSGGKVAKLTAPISKAINGAAVSLGSGLFFGKSIVIDAYDNNKIIISGKAITIAKSSQVNKTALLFFYDTDDHKLELYGLHIKGDPASPKKTAASITVFTHKTIAQVTSVTGNISGGDIFIF